MVNQKTTLLNSCQETPPEVEFDNSTKNVEGSYYYCIG